MSEIYAFTASPGHNGLIDVFAIGDPGDDDSGTTVFLSRAAPGERWPPWASAGLPDLGAIGLQSIAGPDRYGHILARAGGREAAKRQAARPGPGSGPGTSPVCRRGRPRAGEPVMARGRLPPHRASPPPSPSKALSSACPARTMIFESSGLRCLT